MRNTPIFLVVLALAACSRSLPYKYDATLSRPESKAIGPVIALADFRDIRELPSTKAPPWFLLLYKKRFFGVTHQGQKFAPPSRVLRDVIYQELTHAGANVVLLDAAPEEDPTQPTLLSLARQQGAEYLLFGEFRDFSVVVTPPSKGWSLVLRFIPLLGTIANKLLNTWKSEYKLEIQFSLMRVDEGEGEVIWTNRFFDDFVEGRRRKSATVNVLFETLSSVLQKGAGTALDQLDMYLDRKAREALTPLPESATP